MLRYMVTLLFVGLAAGQFHTTCHDNAHYSESQVITLVANVLDRNHDGVYSESEIVVGFAEILHKTLPFGEAVILGFSYQELLSLATLTGFSITKHDFTQQWHLTFHDSLDFAAATFDAFDTNNNAVWSIQEVDNVLNVIKLHYDNGDGIITHPELEAFFNHVYGC